MEQYFVCYDRGDEFVKIDVCDNYHDAVISAVAHTAKRGLLTIVIYGKNVIYRSFP